MMPEHLDILDDTGNVIGRATKDEVYEKKLIHRIVHILVINPADKTVYLQQRAETKSYLPGYYCTSAGGHVQAGETYEEAAKRELREEIGLKTPLQKVHEFIFEEKSHKRFISLFITSAASGFSFTDGEVASGSFYSLGETLALIQKGEKIHPQLEPCVFWLCDNQEEFFG